MENKESVIRRLAGRIRKKYDLCPPIDFKCILEDQNIFYSETNLGTDADGYSDLRDSELKIVVNSASDYLPRKRFTIAHELGHIFIGWHDDVTLCKTDDEYVAHNMLDIQEKEANVFASELLMPTNWVKQQLLEMNSLRMDMVIRSLSSKAQTSIMASFYALENAFDSGNVLIVYSNIIAWGKRFIAANTCECNLIGTDFESSCNILSKVCNVYEIGNYIVQHYQFEPCPDKNKIFNTYTKFNDLISTLENLSDNSIIHILHCAKSILNAIRDSYFLYFYEGDEVLLAETSCSVELQLPYRGTKKNIMELCNYFKIEYKVKELGNNRNLLIVKEPVYKDVKAWMRLQIDSKSLCNQILNELYRGNTLNKKRMSISGIIGSANSSHKDATLEKLYDVIQKKMRRLEFFEFVQHKHFNDFVSLKCYELLSRR